MRVIFSRKGFDSAAGGGPSPILDGRPKSLPIPTRMPSALRYRDLQDDAARHVAAFTRERITDGRACHLDPDLDAPTLPRAAGWRGALGQVGAAQGHLDRQGVTAGDLFLFWGLFQHNSGPPHWQFAGPREHRVFGWLQVGERWQIGSNASELLANHPWLQAHPHMQGGSWPANNTVYLAAPVLSLDGRPSTMPGWGILAHGHRLTAADSPRPSLWEIPAWLDVTQGGVGLTYHPAGRWLGAGRLQSAARGQEFIADIGERADARRWLEELIGDPP